MSLFANRLERHKFVWPPIGTLRSMLAQLALLIEAMDWCRTIAPPGGGATHAVQRIIGTDPFSGHVSIFRS
jgi:transposase